MTDLVKCKVERVLWQMTSVLGLGVYGLAQRTTVTRAGDAVGHEHSRAEVLFVLGVRTKRVVLRRPTLAPLPLGHRC